MYIAITKDYVKNRITLRYGLNKGVLVGTKFIKEVPNMWQSLKAYYQNTAVNLKPFKNPVPEHYVM